MNVLEAREMIEFTCDVLDCDMPQIHFKMRSEDVSKQARYYTSKDLFLNLRAISDPRQACFVIFHELRHHYQICQTEKKEYETKETIEQWKEELSGYKQNGVEGYDDQYLEIDANAFGIYMMYVMYGLRVPVAEHVDVKRINRRMAEIADTFPPQMIKSIAREYRIFRPV